MIFVCEWINHTCIDVCITDTSYMYLRYEAFYAFTCKNHEFWSKIVPKIFNTWPLSKSLGENESWDWACFNENEKAYPAGKRCDEKLDWTNKSLPQTLGDPPNQTMIIENRPSKIPKILKIEKCTIYQAKISTIVLRWPSVAR